MIYRWPTDTRPSSESYYETDYEERQVTEVPGSESIRKLIRTNFSGSWFDKQERIEFLDSVGVTPGRLLDYGCSWGYSTYQYKAAGYDAVGFEVSGERARIGSSKLGLALRSRWEEIDEDEPYDLIVCDHSMEHVSNLRVCMNRLDTALRPGGQLIVFVPNGSGVLARQLGTGWGPFIGESHSMALTCEWFIRNLPRHGLAPRFYRQDGRLVHSLEYLVDDEELIVIARKRS